MANAINVDELVPLGEDPRHRPEPRPHAFSKGLYKVYQVSNVVDQMHLMDRKKSVAVSSGRGTCWSWEIRCSTAT